MKTRRIAVLVLSLAMVLTMGMNVFAVDDGAANNMAGKSIKITKTLKIGEGITVPAEEFVFGFAAGADEYADENGYVSDTTTYPAVAPVKIAYSADDRAEDGTDVEITKQGAVVLPDASAFPKSGMYVYTVSETAGNTEGMTYAAETYFFKVYVKNSKTGEKTIADVEITDGDTKIDGSKGGEDEATNDEDGANDVVGNSFVFTNTFTKDVTKNPGDENGENTDGAFKLEKVLDGDYAGADDEFTFTVKVTLPETAEATTVASEGNAVATFTDGVAKDVVLKGGQSMKFATLPAGTKIEVSEAAFENYTPNYIAKHSANADKTGAVEISSNNSKAETALATAETIVVGEFGANVQYTNKYDAVTPTGIIINNLPYILLIALALGGIVLFTRKKRYE